MYRSFMLFRSLLAVALAAPSLAATAQLHLIPEPRSLTSKGDAALRGGVSVLCEGCDSEDRFAAADLQQTLEQRGIPSGNGFRIVLHRLAQYPEAGFTDAMKPEGYTIAASPGTLTLTGASASGVFYAAQTVKQLIVASPNGGFVVHLADIRDWPAMKYRGLHDDLSRGPVDTLDFQKKIIRTLAAYKDNIYSPYFEHTQQYASNPIPAPPGGSMTADDARQLVAYARQYHITVIPEQEAFGHLHHALVWEQSSALAETPHGSVLAPGQPGSLPAIKSMFTELAALYPSPFLHIGADETEELGKGQTKPAVDSRGLGPVYLDFMQQIVTTLQPLNRRLLFWGDIAEKSPDLLKAMPQSFKQQTIAVAWGYTPQPKGFSKYLKPYLDAGFETWVASGINNWSRVYPNNNYALNDIQQFTRDGQAMGATGQLNTIWYDDGEALASNNWYGILFGAAAAWQPGESSIPDFQNSYGEVFHGDLTGKLDEAQRELMAAHALLKSAKVGDGSDGLFWLDPWSKDGQRYASMMRPINAELRQHAEHALRLIAEARAAAPAPQQPVVYSLVNQLPSNPTSLRETDAIDALELGARRMDFIGLKFQLGDEIPQMYARISSEAPANASTHKGQLDITIELADINGINGRFQDIKDTYALIRDLYMQLWLRTNRPYALRPVLDHYDYTNGIWLGRIDRFKSAQRQWDDLHTLPPASDLGFPPAS
ncbi:MAG: family 20 glycosylhydrolase [Acidobacteriaceae bacterium]|nr:family 20 glycosylhydrolase [Acidobacteriaceae bacterium]